jgi:hypothetical protein
MALGIAGPLGAAFETYFDSHLCCVFLYVLSIWQMIYRRPPDHASRMSSKGKVENGTAPVSVIKTCSSSFTPSPPPSAPM